MEFEHTRHKNYTIIVNILYNQEPRASNFLKHINFEHKLQGLNPVLIVTSLERLTAASDGIFYLINKLR